MKARKKAGQKRLFPTVFQAKHAPGPGLFWTGWLIVCSLATGCCELANAGEKFEPQAISFDSSESGKLPTDFSTALTGGGGPVSWVVREYPTAPKSQKVLLQESSDATSYRFPLCIYEKTIASDVAVEVNYKAISGKVDQA